MSTFAQLASETGVVQRIFWRNRVGAFFSLLLPLFFLVIFASSDQTVKLSDGGPDVSYASFFVPGMLWMAIVVTTFVATCIMLSVQRDLGILKRLRGTPLPPAVLFGSMALSALLTVAIEGAILLTVGSVAYDAALPESAAAWEGSVAVVLVGALCLALVAVAYAALVPNGQSAPVMVNVVYIPAMLISGAWFPTDELPRWLDDIAQALPFVHLADGMRQALVEGQGLGDLGGALWPLAAWAAVAMLVALRRFRWEPRRR